MLDPFTALGVASAIVQFVDFTSKLLTEGYGAYQSVVGASKEDIDVQALATDLETICASLASSPPVGSTILSKEELALQNLARKCQGIAKELVGVLEDLKVKTHGLLRGWDTVRSTVRRAMDRRKIEKLQKTLDSIKTQVNTHLLAAIR